METEFVTPGPGEWALDRSHYPGGATPISQWLLSEGLRDGITRVFAEMGTPAERIDLAFVHGFMYTRLRPLVGADKPPKKAPPKFVLQLATRLHPQFRARNKTAIATLRDRPSNAVVARWENEIRPRLQTTNRTFQAFDTQAATDSELQGHINELITELRDNFVLHFWLHGHDLGPIAKYLHDCLGWGLDPIEAIGALAGASPTTAEPLEAMLKLRTLSDSAGINVTSLDDIRSVSSEASEALDTYLEERACVLATGYDVDSLTLGEMPDSIVNAIRSATRPPVHDTDGAAARLRAHVPNASHADFDQALADARNVMDMRDDNGPLTIEWPVGLLRLALLAAGARLVESGTISTAEHVFELEPAELKVLFGDALPPADELERRFEARTARGKLDAPATLGPPEPEPPLDALPPALRSLIAMTQVAIKYMGMDGSTQADGLSGAGVGDHCYTGTARVASSADEAFDRLEPGDVLIVRATSPAFNAVLAIAGAVVTADGGVLSHAAVLSRELGIPAVIGAHDALTITDGSTVEVDPAAGVVRVKVRA